MAAERPDDAIELARTAHAALLAQLETMAAAGCDPTTPSLLPGWSIGHVLTHLARNADALARLLGGAERGEPTEMYVGGAPARNAAIDAGATRSWRELVNDVRESSGALESQFDSQQAWSGSGTGSAGQTFLAVDVPFIRCREVFVHTADLGDAGYGPEDWPAAYVDHELSALTATWIERNPQAGSSLPAAVAERPKLDRLVWLLGRADIDGVGPANTF